MPINIPQRFDALSLQLQQTHSYWSDAAFHQEELPWAAQHPALVAELLKLPESRVAALADDARSLAQFLAPHLPFAEDLYHLAQVPPLKLRDSAPVPARFYAGVPGRKWQQVKAFADTLPASDLPLLEWCAGKSHLGFYLQHSQSVPVDALEWDANLVAQANQRAQQNAVALCSHTVDVLSDAVIPHISSNKRVVALHACGQLHERLLQVGVAQGCAQLHVAPCCYHKRGNASYRPLSQRGQSTGLRLTKQQLHTAVMETVTAGATVQRQRQALQKMRLGFDELQRDLTGNDAYLPLPSMPNTWARATFAEFCHHCAALKQLKLPQQVAWDKYKKRGEQRFLRVQAMDLVRFLFRRPLELWLVLDRALYLLENGYQVQLGTFCAPQITPRNLIVQAWLE